MNITDISGVLAVDDCVLVPECITVSQNVSFNTVLVVQYVRSVTLTTVVPNGKIVKTSKLCTARSFTFEALVLQHARKQGLLHSAMMIYKYLNHLVSNKLLTKKCG